MATTKTTKTAAAKKPVNLKAATPAAAPTQEAPLHLRLQASLDAMLAEHYAALGLPVPTWKRTLLAFTLSLAAASGAGYLIGTLGGWLMASAFAATSSAFIACVILVLTVLLGAYAGMKVSQKVGMYVLTGDIDRDLVRAKDWITTKFATPKLAAA